MCVTLTLRNIPFHYFTAGKKMYPYILSRQKTTYFTLKSIFRYFRKDVYAVHLESSNSKIFLITTAVEVLAERLPDLAVVFAVLFQLLF